MKKFEFVVLSLYLASFPVITAQNPDMQALPEVSQLVVRAFHPDLAQLEPWLKDFDVWYQDQGTGEVVLVIDRSRINELNDLDFSWSPDLQQTKMLNTPPGPLPGQVAGIPGFPCYRTVEETFQTAQTLVATYPTLVSWTDLGDSWEKTRNAEEGWDILLLKITNSAIGGEKPRFFVNAGIHAREYTTAELSTRFAEYLLDHYQTDADIRWLVDYHEIHLILQANPDGRKRAETGLSWRKNANNDFCGNSNSRGIDLNRNFEFQWGCCKGSSSNACDETFHGSGPGSEPETQVIQDHMRNIFPDQRPDDLTTPAPLTATGLVIDLHSYGEVILSSWGFSTAPPPNAAELMTLSRKLGFYNQYQPHLGSLSTVSGATKDFAYGILGVPGYTIELGTSFFQDCTFFEQNILPGNIAALVESAKLVRTPYITPAGPEFESIQLGAIVVEPGENLTLSAVVNDDRYSTTGGVQPVQPVVSADFYVDTPPWAAGATPLPFSPQDGTFDEVSEAVTAVLNTTGLDEGEHILFFEGRDSDDNPGPVSAHFFYILDPLLAPRIEGFVRNSSSGVPILATVCSNSFSTTTDESGFYRLLLPEGQYTLTISAEGFLGQEIGPVNAINGQTTTVNVTLQAICPVFEDDFEAGQNNWTTSGTWAQTTAQSASPTHSWTDSPAGLYGPNVNMSLTSPMLDLSNTTGVSLNFKHRYDTEASFDFCIVEISTDNGTNWSTVSSYSGNSQTWLDQEIQLPGLDGAAQARIRFRFDSDGNTQADGWYVDDVRILGVTPGCASLTLNEMYLLWPNTFDIRDLVFAANNQ